MGEASSCGVERDMLFKRAVAGEMRRFLDAAETTKVLGAVGLFMTQDLTNPADDVLECGV